MRRVDGELMQEQHHQQQQQQQQQQQELHHQPEVRATSVNLIAQRVSQSSSSPIEHRSSGSSSSDNVRPTTPRKGALERIDLPEEACLRNSSNNSSQNKSEE